MTYKSAIDWWYWLLLGAVAVLLIVIAFPLYSRGEINALVVLGLSGCVSIGLPIWLAFSTIYEITELHLIVRSGPFKWIIEKSTIRRVQPSRSILSSPALSLNRLEIIYGSGQSILVSPTDITGFVEDLGFED